MTFQDEQKQPPQEDANLKNIVQQLEDLVLFVLESEDKELNPNISIFEIHSKLASLKAQMDQFQKFCNERLRAVGLPDDALKLNKQQLEEMGSQEKILMKRLEAITNRCEEAKEKVYQSLQENKEVLKQIHNDQKAQEGKKGARAAKFKNVGGKKNWLPS